MHHSGLVRGYASGVSNCARWVTQTLILFLEQLSMTEISYVTARIAQRFDKIVSPKGQDNLVKGYAVLVQPKNGVKARLRYAL